MNFEETARQFGMTPPPRYSPPSFEQYHMIPTPKQAVDSQNIKYIPSKISTTTAQSEPRLHTQTPPSNGHSDTYDDDIDTETEDYLTDNEDDEIFINDPRKEGLLSSNDRKSNSKQSKATNVKPKAVRSRTMSRPTCASNLNFLRIPNESDDNFDETDECEANDALNNTLDIPLINTKLHIRSYSESNIQKTIQNDQWPSSPSSDDTFEFDANSVDSTVYSRYVSMKKKYKKQRRISRQFQDAITVIQDGNEDVMTENERRIRSRFAREYEMKLIELEHEKLNNAMNIEDKMKQVLLKNDELLFQNKQLQQQVAAQVAMIQEQQHFAFQTQRQFVAMQSADSPISSLGHHSPLATMTQFPSTQAILGRVSSASTPNTIHGISNIAPHMLNGVAGHNTLGLTSLSSHGGESSNYTLNDDIASIMTDITNEDILSHNKYNNINMESSAKYNQTKSNKKQKRYHVSKRKKIKDLELKLCKSDDEIMKKIGSTQSSWTRFVELMTPSFCSCSPGTPRSKLS